MVAVGRYRGSNIWPAKTRTFPANPQSPILSLESHPQPRIPNPEMLVKKDNTYVWISPGYRLDLLPVFDDAIKICYCTNIIFGMGGDAGSLLYATN